MPRLIIIGGPNGAGKTTASMQILPSLVDCSEFVNADEIAAGISPFNPESLAIESSRLALRRISMLADSGVDFAFESTLASRGLRKIITDIRARNYIVDIAFIWIDNPTMAVTRVRKWAEAGGHFIPDDVVLRRYERSCNNFYWKYRQLADNWYFYDNSRLSTRLVAHAICGQDPEVLDNDVWLSFVSGRMPLQDMP